MENMKQDQKENIKMKFEPGTRVRVVKKIDEDPAYNVGNEFFILGPQGGWRRDAFRCSKEKSGSYDACIYEDELEAIKPELKFQIGDRVNFTSYYYREFGQLTGTVIEQDDSNVPYLIRLDKPISHFSCQWAAEEDMELLEEKKSILPNTNHNIPMSEVKEPPTTTTFKIGDKVEFVLDPIEPDRKAWRKGNVANGTIQEYLPDTATYIINGPSFSDVDGNSYYRRESQIRLKEDSKCKTSIVPKFQVGDRVEFYHGIQDCGTELKQGIIQTMGKCGPTYRYTIIRGNTKYIKDEGEIYKENVKKDSNKKTSAVPKSATTSVSNEHPDDQFNRKESHMLDSKQEKRLKSASRYSRLSFWGGLLIGTGAANIVVPVLQKAAVFIGQFLVSVGAPPH